MTPFAFAACTLQPVAHLICRFGMHPSISRQSFFVAKKEPAPSRSRNSRGGRKRGFQPSNLGNSGGAFTLILLHSGRVLSSLVSAFIANFEWTSLFLSAAIKDISCGACGGDGCREREFDTDPPLSLSLKDAHGSHGCDGVGGSDAIISAADATSERVKEQSPRCGTGARAIGGGAEGKNCTYAFER